MAKKYLSILLLILAFSMPARTANAQGYQPKEIVVANSNAPSVVGLSDGRLLTVLDSPNGEGICERYSDDNGVRWSAEVSIINSTQGHEADVPGGYIATFCSLLKDDNLLLLFYERYVSWKPLKYCTVWKLESYDDGSTWVNDSKIDSGVHQYVLASYGAIKLKDGKLVLPISWWWKTVGGNPDFWRVGTLFSDDNGETWLEGGQIPDWNGSTNGLDEPSIVELSNGSLYCLLRTYGYGENRVHGYSISNDGGLTWSDVQGIAIMSSFNTTPALLRYSWNPNIVLVAWVNRTEGGDQLERRPLVVAYSIDDCTTWQGAMIMDNGNASESMNEERFALANGMIFLSYHRYSDANVSSSESVVIKFPFKSVAETELVQAFGSQMNDIGWHSSVDLNHDGTINILDAILLASRN